MTAATKKSCRSKMPYVISIRSVTDGVSQSISKSELVYSSLIYVDNNNNNNNNNNDRLTAFDPGQPG